MSTPYGREGASNNACKDGQGEGGGQVRSHRGGAVEGDAATPQRFGLLANVQKLFSLSANLQHTISASQESSTEDPHRHLLSHLYNICDLLLSFSANAIGSLCLRIGIGTPKNVPYLCHWRGPSSKWTAFSVLFLSERRGHLKVIVSSPSFVKD